MAPFVRRKGRALDLQESEKCLKMHKRYEDLVELYKAIGKHEEGVLGIVAMLGCNCKPMHSFGSSCCKDILHMRGCEQEYLYPSTHNHYASPPPPPHTHTHSTPALTLLFDCHKHSFTRTLEGIRPTREYLKMLGNANIDIVFRFSVWVLEENAEGGLKVRLFVMYSGTCL